MKISAKTQILMLVLAIFGAVLVCIACARMEQTEAARAEAEETGDAPEIHPPVPETPEIARTGAEAPGRVEDARGPVLQDFVEFVNMESEIDDAELEMLACVIYTEAGGNACSDLCRMMVGDVALNRVEDPRFPGTLEEVLTDEGQYGLWFWTGIQWPDRANDPDEAGAVAQAYDTARYILEGNHSGIYGQGYIWEAEFPQGIDVIALDGLYFGR